MSNKQEFINFVEEMYETFHKEMPEGAKKYFESLKVEKPQKEKPQFTDNGKLILHYMKNNYQINPYFTAKQIAEGIEITSRGVSGAIRKLVMDGYAEKVSEEPVQYALTDKGIEVEIV